MKEIKIDTFSALHDLIETYDARTVIYRGIKSVKYPLMPKVGRSVQAGATMQSLLDLQCGANESGPKL